MLSLQSSRGQLEKLEAARVELKNASEEKGWEVEFSTDQVQNKLDASMKKVKRIYSRFQR